MTTAIGILIGAVLAAPGTWYAGRNPEFGYWWYGFWTLVSAGLVGFNVATRDWPWAVWTVACTAANAWQWWKCRRKRKRRRAMAAIGAKTRAIRDAMVRKVREAAKPRPVLRPSPSPAG